MRRRVAFDRGRWQTHRERCHITDRNPPPKDGDAIPAGEAITEVMRSLGLQESLWLHALEEEWIRLVGTKVAKHARPGRYEDGRLIVFVDSSVWLNELKRYGREEILDKLQNRFGQDRIKTLVLQPDPEG